MSNFYYKRSASEEALSSMPHDHISLGSKEVHNVDNNTGDNTAPYTVYNSANRTSRVVQNNKSKQ
jgi:hypothetical protein